MKTFKQSVMETLYAIGLLMLILTTVCFIPILFLGTGIDSLSKHISPEKYQENLDNTKNMTKAQKILGDVLLIIISTMFLFFDLIGITYLLYQFTLEPKRRFRDNWILETLFR